MFQAGPIIIIIENTLIAKTALKPIDTEDRKEYHFKKELNYLKINVHIEDLKFIETFWIKKI